MEGIFGLKAEDPAMNSLQITREPIELYKALKLEGLCSSGGEAKMVIADGAVLLNGQLETRKRKKLVVGDVVTFDNQSFQIQLAG